MVGATRKRRDTTAMSDATRKRRDTTAMSDATQRKLAITRALLRWYDENQRDLPWRHRPDPYATWVSEIMLQQTQVAAVIPYFERWMRQFPSVSALANADVAAVLAAWQGLGYYSRARNLHLGAQRIRDDYAGRLPSSPRILRQLPGIGEYTAGAIASIAFDLPEPAVDGNVMRVLTRLEALRGDPRLFPQAARIRQIAGDWVHCNSPSRFNQSLMELGALVCVPKAPRCSQCPLLKHCRAHELELTDQLPDLPRRPKPEIRQVVVLVVERRGAWLVVEQPDSARHWAGLFTFPYAELRPAEKPHAAAKRLLAHLDPKATLQDSEPLTCFTYPITRFRFQAIAYGAKAVGTKLQTKLGGRYASTEQLVQLALPAPHRRLLERLRPGMPVAEQAVRSR